MMSKAVVKMLITMLAGWLVFASQITTAEEHGVPAAVKVKLFEGVVSNVTLADPEKEVRSEITVTDQIGKNSSFLVTATTTIYNSNWKVASLIQIAKGERVKVRYITTKDGLNVARSIHRLGK